MSGFGIDCTVDATSQLSGHAVKSRERVCNSIQLKPCSLIGAQRRFHSLFHSRNQSFLTHPPRLRDNVSEGRGHIPIYRTLYAIHSWGFELGIQLWKWCRRTLGGPSARRSLINVGSDISPTAQLSSADGFGLNTLRHPVTSSHRHVELQNWQNWQ